MRNLQKVLQNEARPEAALDGALGTKASQVQHVLEDVLEYIQAQAAFEYPFGRSTVQVPALSKGLHQFPELAETHPATAQGRPQDWREAGRYAKFPQQNE